jgi:hypothetical protein
MCLKCAGGKQVTITIPVLQKASDLKKRLGLDCTSDVILHAFTVLEKDLSSRSPTAPTNAKTTTYHMVRSNSTAPVHLATVLGDGKPVLCGKPMRNKWSPVTGAIAADICSACRNAAAAPITL